MDLSKLIIDIDYQKEYDYEKRVDLFNKYGVSVSEKFFVPMWALANYITSLCGIMTKTHYPQYGHGQNVLYEINTVELENGSVPRIKTHGVNKSIIDIHFYIPNLPECKFYGRRRKVLRFNLKNKTINVNNYCNSNSSSCCIPRNLYEKIDEWLVDFGYEKWS